MIKLFPTYFEQKPLRIKPKLHSALIREALKFEEMDDQGMKWCKENYPFGYTSYGSLSQIHEISPNFYELFQAITKEVMRYARALNFDFDEGSLELSQAWVNVMRRGCQHSFHLHPLSSVSGTYYLNAPKGEGGFFKIEDPRIMSFMGSAPRKPHSKKDHARYIKILPKDRDLILFESFLKHEVTPYYGNYPRISVSFNYDWKSR